MNIKAKKKGDKSKKLEDTSIERSKIFVIKPNSGGRPANDKSIRVNHTLK
jgi:hypothetical protein